MLTLNDGRNELWQWDTGRKLTVDADCSQVHFSNKVFGRSIDVDVIEGTATIPDVLLQTDKELTAWAFAGTAENGYTKIEKTFKVNRRNKPADYVFTPPEQTTLGQIMKRLDRIEESQDPDAIKNAVDDYLVNNPIQIDETDPTVPAWAKQATKPKYTAAEVGAVATVNGVKPDANGNVQITIPDSGGNVGHVVQDTPPEDTSVLWIDTDDDSSVELPSLDGYAKIEDVPTDEEIIQLIKDNVSESSGGGIAVTGATVGQTVKIAEVDENGVPTAWESVDFPSGKELVGSIKLSESVASVEFELKKPCTDLAIFIRYGWNGLIDKEGNGKGDARLNLKINDSGASWCCGNLSAGNSRAVTVDVKMSSSGHVSCRGSNVNTWGMGYSTGITEFNFIANGEKINKISLYSSNTDYLISTGFEIVVMGA